MAEQPNTGGDNPAAPPQPAPADPKEQPQGQPPPRPAPPDDLEARAKAIADRIVSEREAAAAKKAEAERKRLEEEEAKKRGDFEKLLASEKLAREHAELRSRQAEVRGRLRDYVASHHPEYAVAAEKDADPPTALMWDSIAGQVNAGMDDGEADKLIKATVERFMKAIPRQAKGTGAPPPPAHGARLPAADKPQPAGANGSNSRRLSVMGGM
jgi:hypothetical protein